MIIEDKIRDAINLILTEKQQKYRKRKKYIEQQMSRDNLIYKTGNKKRN